jgi:molybdopterin/thiamine biosynthesis adenylyltransferase
MNVLVVGVGSVGSAFADMCRTKKWDLTLIDPDVLGERNLYRHVLRKDSLGKSKALELARILGCQGIHDTFSVPPQRPDVIVACVDSLVCESQINTYALGENIPVVYGGVHGDAHTAEIITVIPGKTPCYDCYEREGPEKPVEAYTVPGWDQTRTAHQEGLWADILMCASLQFQAVLGVMGLRERFSPLVLASLRYPFKIERFDQEERCAICTNDFSRLCV